MLEKCDNCAQARKACHKDYVMCAFYQSKLEEYSATHSHMSVVELVNEIVPWNLEVATGWASRIKPNKGESHWSVRGTVTEGLLTNDQLLVRKDCCCSKFQMTPEIQ